MIENNIFEHIFYEIIEYFYTYDLLKNPISRINNKCNIFNSIWDSHFLHMRNLKDFFANKKTKKDDIVLDTILELSLINKCLLNDKELEYKVKLIVDGGNLTYPTIINKSVEHLTMARINTWKIPKTLKELQYETIDDMMKILFPHISKFISLLLSSQNIKKNYRQDLKEKQDTLNYIYQCILPYLGKNI